MKWIYIRKTSWRICLAEGGGRFKKSGMNQVSFFLRRNLEVKIRMKVRIAAVEHFEDLTGEIIKNSCSFEFTFSFLKNLIVNDTYWEFFLYKIKNSNAFEGVDFECFMGSWDTFLPILKSLQSWNCWKYYITASIIELLIN